MMPEERLVTQIREFVRQENPEPTPEIEDLSEQYAELCEVVNQRLVKCGDFLNQGMRSEAVYEMQVPPPLLEQVNVLNFREVTKWRNLCEDFGLRVFPNLRVDIVDRLRAEATTEEALAPLLNEYRRLVHHGSRDDRIRILRRIREHDPDNPVWHENLAPLEEEQLEELIPEVEEALRSDDLRTLGRLREDLDHPQRACQAPEELLRQVNSVLRSSELREGRAKADECLGELEAAYEEQDEERLETWLTAWDEVTADDEIKVDPGNRERVETIRKWVQSEQNKRRVDRQFQETLANLEAQITRDLPEREEVRRLWRDAMAADRPIPGDVRERVMTAISRVDEHERSRHRRRSLVGAAAAILILALLLGLGVVVHSVQKRNRLERQVATLVENENYRDALDVLERIRGENPSLYASADMQQLQSQARGALDKRERRTVRFETVMEQLRNRQKAGIDGAGERMRRLEEEARSLAVDPQQKALLQSWRESRELARLRDREQREARFSQALDLLETRLDSMPRQERASFEGEQRAINELREQRAELQRKVSGLSDKSRQRLDALSEGLDAWQQNLNARKEERKEERENKERTLRAIRNAPPDLELFQTLLRGFVEDYPDDPNTPRFQRLIEDVPLYRDALALGSFSAADIPLSDAETAAAKQRLAALPQGERSIWHADLSQAVAVTQRFPEAVQQLQQLRELPGLHLNVFEIRPKDTQVWQKIYYPESIRNREGELYWGRVYRSSPEEATPWLEHRKFSSEDYDLRISRLNAANRVPHAKYVRELLGQLKNRDQRIDVFLCQTMSDILKHEDLPVIPKAWLLDICSAALQKCTLRPVAGLQRIRELLGDVPRVKNWFHPSHPDILQLRQRLRQALDQFPEIQPLQESIRGQQKLLAATLSRQVNYAGRVGVAEDGSRSLNLPAELPEAWIITVNSERRTREFQIVFPPKAGNRAKGILEGEQPFLYPGRLLFSPGDGRKSKDLLRELGVSRKTAEQLSSWPRL